MKKFLLPIFTFLLVITGFVFAPNTSNAESVDIPENVDTSLSYENYQKLIDLEILDESFPYETWVEINSEDRTNHLNSGSSNNKPMLMAAPALVRGDILISNGTSSFGLTGHAGIVVGANEILHIAGHGYVPKVIGFDSWTERYGKGKGGNTKTEVYRISNWTHRNNAADWARKTYEGSGANYSLMSSLDSFAWTYCSKIVWQAYHYGSSISLVNKPVSDIATPYGLPDYFKSSAGLSYQFNF